MSGKVKQDYIQSLDSWLAWLDAQSVIWLALVSGLLAFWSFQHQDCSLTLLRSSCYWQVCDFAKVVGVSADGLTGSCTSEIAETASSSDRWVAHLTGILWLGSLLCDSDVAWLNVMFVTSEPSVVLVVGDPIRVWCDIFGLNVSWFPLIWTVISEPDGLTRQVDIVVLLRRLQMCWAVVAKVGLLLIS